LKRIARTILPVGMAAVFLPVFAAVPSSARAALPAGAARTQAAQWGSYFGDSVAAHRDTTLLPEAFTFQSRVIQVGSSNSTQYALLKDGTVWAWGQGTRDELGNGRTANAFTRPVQVKFPHGVRIAFLATDAMPFDTALAVDRNGHAWGWGFNKRGELCLGNTRADKRPAELPFKKVTALAGANGHAVYLASYRGLTGVWSCGSNNEGVGGLGYRGGPNHLRPVAVTGLPSNVVGLYSAYDNAGALTASGAYYDWGYNKAGQLGSGTAGRPSGTPVKVSLPGIVTQAAQGGSAGKNGQTLVMLATGALYAWGNDTAGQLGNGRTTSSARPVRFSPPHGVTYAILATGGATSYAIDTKGHVWAWGNGTAGQLGNGDRRSSTAPVKVEVESRATMISSTANDAVVDS
jgi:alpha-tubulin suppressor-like RCC1 family protein